MKKKSISKRIIKGFMVLILTIIALVLVINIPVFTLNNNISNTDYSNWMSETLDGDELIKDIAMLGAHDAFSNKITIASPLDPYETNSIMQGATGLLVKGFIVRQSRTQMSDASTLLKAGVRYLDIRLSYSNDTWYTKHNYLSEEFLPILDEIKTFVEENPGEFLILDFQHISGIDYSSATDYQVFYDMLSDSGILDYAMNINDLETLTYGTLTNNKTEGKVIITTKFESSTGLILPYQDTIRSEWADSDDFEYIYQFLETEGSAIQSANINDRFRVMQGVSTMQMTGDGIVNSLKTWSLINRAKDFNVYLIRQPNFTDLLVEMPIIMVDYANSNTNNFNEDIMQIIMDFNENS